MTTKADAGRLERVNRVLDSSGLPYRPMTDDEGNTFGFLLTNYNVCILIDDEHADRTSNDRYQNKIILKGNAAIDMWCALFAMSGYA